MVAAMSEHLWIWPAFVTVSSLLIAIACSPPSVRVPAIRSAMLALALLCSLSAWLLWAIIR